MASLGGARQSRTICRDTTSRCFPVVETEIGRLGAAICYDWLFPESIRALALGGAEVLIRVSAYMDPWGATAPMDWWTLFNRARAVENFAFVVAANQARARRIIRRSHGRAAAWWSTTTGGFCRRPTRAPARRSWWGRSIWLHCGPSGSGGEAIISFRTYGPKPILISTPGLSFAPADGRHEMPRVRPGNQHAHARHRLSSCARPGVCESVDSD